MNTEEIWALAEEARRPLYPVHWPKDPQVPEAFVEAAILAATLFSRRWLLAATRATQAKGGAAGWRYWIGCLRNGLVEIERLEPFANREACASFYAQLTQAVQPIALEILAEFGDVELVPASSAKTPAAASQPEPRAAAGIKDEFRKRFLQGGPQ